MPFLLITVSLILFLFVLEINQLDLEIKVEFAGILGGNPR
jgi:hypothetical protein